jgi:hypothetical protein
MVYLRDANVCTVQSHTVMENRIWGANFPWHHSWNLRWRHVRLLQYTLLLIAIGEAIQLTECPSWPIRLKPSDFQQQGLSKFFWMSTVIMLPLHGLPIHLWSLIVKPGLVTNNQSGKQYLRVPVVKSEQLLPILHPSLLLFGHEIPWNLMCINLLHPQVCE